MCRVFRPCTSRVVRDSLLVAAASVLAACQPRPNLRPAADSRSPAPAGVSVMTSGGFTAAFDLLGPRFERETAIVLRTVYGASSGGAPDSIPERLSRAEPADVIILSKGSLDNLTALGEVRPESRVDLVRSSIGMAVRRGAARPDISSKEAFIEALLRGRIHWLFRERQWNVFVHGAFSSSGNLGAHSRQEPTHRE